MYSLAIEYTYNIYTLLIITLQCVTEARVMSMKIKSWCKGLNHPHHPHPHHHHYHGIITTSKHEDQEGRRSVLSHIFLNRIKWGDRNIQSTNYLSCEKREMLLQELLWFSLHANISNTMEKKIVWDISIERKIIIPFNT